MKGLKLYFAIIALMFLLPNCKKDKQIGDCNSYPVPSDSYRYPILPGTAAWANLQTGDERLQACQIPVNQLLQMSTEGLIQSWLDMPLNIEIYATNSLQAAMVYFIENFSGLEELVKRNDAAAKLFSRYQSMNPACISNIPLTIDKGKFTFLFSYIELLLAQDTILNKMTLEEKKILVKEALSKYDSRINYGEYFDELNRDLALFICAKTMQNCEYLPFLSQVNNELYWFMNNALFPVPLGDYRVEKNIIITQAREFSR